MHAWLMSIVCIALVIFAAAAATRLPHYLTTSNYARLLGVVLFDLLAFIGLADNLHTHFSIWQRQTKLASSQTEVTAHN